MVTAEKICILLLFWLPSILAISKQTTISNSTIALPGCSTSCGNLTVPYPFGVGLDGGCSIAPWFDIICNMSFNPPKPFLGRTNGEIISISDTKIRLKTDILMAKRCYTQTTVDENPTSPYRIVEIDASPFSFSNQNKFFVVGCDDTAFIEGSEHDGSSFSFCDAVCQNTSNLRDKTCGGIGCCQKTILPGLKKVTIGLSSSTNHTNVSSFNPCGYAFVGEKDSYEFKVSDVWDSSFANRIIETVPVAIDWLIGNQTCDEARKSRTLACRENTICLDSDTRGLRGRGYRCNCSHGYEGNPYLKSGCQDINECEKNNPCDKDMICTNTQGSYICSCPHGHRKYGSGCIPRYSTKALVIYTGLGTGIVFLLLLGVGYWLYKLLKKRKPQLEYRF